MVQIKTIESARRSTQNPKQRGELEHGIEPKESGPTTKHLRKQGKGNYRESEQLFEMDNFK